MRAARRDWEPHEDDLVRRMWAQNHTQAEIGAALGGRSESAVRWKIRYLALPKRPVGRQPTYGTTGVPRQRTSTPRPRSPRQKVARFEGEFEPIRFIGRKRTECAFIAGDVLGPETMCCGRPVDGEGAWCAGHRTICTIEVRE